MKKALTAFLCLLCFNSFSQVPVAASEKPVYLPSDLINGRFYIKIPTPNGDTVLAFCDSGGGYNAIYTSTISSLHLGAKVLTVTIDGQKINYIPASEVIGDPNIPAPHIWSYYQQEIKKPFFNVPDNNEENEFIVKYVPQQAFLGQWFFIDHAWTFDYLHGKVYINTPLSAAAMDENTQRIGFKKDKDGNKMFGHPSMKVEIDGQVIDMLFDTGASIFLSKTTQAELQSSSLSIAGSFIAKSIFDQWRTAHPGWHFIEKGEVTGFDMIQVPLVKVGNTTAGPVWFAKRPDEAWSKGMIRSMDKVVKGAIGGSFFQYYTVTIDYNNELLKFVKER